MTIAPETTILDSIDPIALRQQITDLNRRLAESRQVNQQLEEQLSMFSQTLDMLDDMVLIKGPKSQIVYANQAFRTLYGMNEEQIQGMIDAPLNEPDYTQQYIHDDEQVFTTGQRLVIPQEPVTRYDGAVRMVRTVKSPIYNADGQVTHTAGIMQDTTERKRAEETMRQGMIQEEKIRAQQTALEELSTPLIPITDQIVVMPLIGALDSRRAQQVVSALLQGVSETRARTAILDITGVSVVDTQVANALIRAAQSVQLLGAQVMITGIRPEVAQTLIGLGVDLRGIITHSSLQSAIASAMARN